MIKRLKSVMSVFMVYLFFIPNYTYLSCADNSTILEKEEILDQD